MSFPIPSFTKIRLVTIILCFFVLFFLVGFVRWCFAYNIPEDNTLSPGDCVQPSNLPADALLEVKDLAPIPSLHCTPDGGQAPYNDQNYFNGFYSVFTGQRVENYAYGENGCDGNTTPYYVTYRYYVYYPSPACVGQDQDYPPQDCETLIQNFLDSCPFQMGTYNCESESGECYTPDCNELQDHVQDNLCPNQDYSFTCNTDNDGNVQDYDYECKDCAARASQWADANCNGIANVDNWSCETNQGNCKDYNCNDLLAQCYSQCSNQVDNFSCNDTSGTPVVSVPCDCQTSTPDIAAGETGEEPPPGQEPDTTTPETATTDPNSKITAANTKLIANINGQYLPEINKSIKANGSKIDQTNDTLKSIDNTLDSIDNNLESLDRNFDGTYTKETITNNYTIDEGLNQTSQFTDRFGSFITDLKATPLFSLPNQVLFNIPNSTESSYTIEMGQYGQAEIDLSQYASSLLILRAAFLLCFCYAGLRIVVSKK